MFYSLKNKIICLQWTDLQYFIRMKTNLLKRISKND
jgi:hypothetical protein